MKKMRVSVNPSKSKSLLDMCQLYLNPLSTTIVIITTFWIITEFEIVNHDFFYG